METNLINTISPIIKMFDTPMHKAKVKTPAGEPPGLDQSSSPPPEEGPGVLSAIADVFEKGKKLIELFIYTHLIGKKWGQKKVGTVPIFARKN